MQREQKDKTISGTLTLVIVLLSVALCAWLGYYPPDPPIPEEGMGVAGEVLGEIEGFGNNDDATFDDAPAAPSASTPSQESYTTQQESAPVAKPTQTDPKPTPTPAKENASDNNQSNASQSQNSQPSTNPNASFPGRSKNNGGEGKGTATGSGQAGSPDGTQGAQGGSGKGNGAGYSLSGRKLRGDLPVPSYKSDKDGDVVVRIKVDQSGSVIDVEAPYKGSKNYDNAMVKEAKTAAMKAKFNADPSATEYQYGTITYKFRHMG